MTAKTKITCDHCGADLTTTSNYTGTRIVLASEDIPPCAGGSTSMPVHPEFEEPLHFCGWRCLSEWVRKERDD